jgi:Mrp family chromosome partitioning ATPase
MPAMNRVLDDLADAFDYVVLDGPPLLPVADAQVLLQNPAIDVVLIVARPYLTTREYVRSTLAVLKRHPEKGFGLVVNAVRERAGGYYGYRKRHADDDVVFGDGTALSSSPPARGSAENLDHVVDPRSEPN